MAHSHQGKGLRIEAPATYRIRVQGSLDKSWSDSLAGMGITTEDQGDSAPVTVLLGRVMDQAELTGVLNSLYELHLPILSVEILDEDSAADQNDPDN